MSNLGEENGKKKNHMEKLSNWKSENIPINSIDKFLKNLLKLLNVQSKDFFSKTKQI